MDPLTGLLVLAASALAGGLGLRGALDRRTRREWTCTWNGHAVRLVARESRKELYVDGVQVAAKTTLSGSGSSLAWTFQDDSGGPAVVLTATVTYLTPGAPVGAIYAAGAWIGGATTAPATARPPVDGEPRDPRWAAAKVLLVDLQRAEDSRVRDAAARVELGLRGTLGRLDRLEGARAAHAALGGGENDGAELGGAKLEAAHDRLEREIPELLGALRQLHLVSLTDRPTPGLPAPGRAAPALAQVEDLLGRIAAEAEVARLDNGPPRRERPLPERG